MSVVLGLHLGWSGPAAAQADPEPPTGRHHLFSPTPRSTMRELSTDRPDATESASSVDAGHVQFETDVVSWERARVRSKGNSTVRVGTTSVRIGILPRADLQLIIRPLEVARRADDVTGVQRWNHGLGDGAVRLKINLFGNDEGNVAMALLPYVTVPMGVPRALRSVRAEFGLIVPLSASLPHGFDFGAQVQIGARAGEARQYVPALYWTMTVSHAVAGELSAFLEVASAQQMEGTVQATFELHGGFTLGIGPDVQLDAGVFGTLVGGAPDLLVFLGTTFRR